MIRRESASVGRYRIGETREVGSAREDATRWPPAGRCMMSETWEVEQRPQVAPEGGRDLFFRSAGSPGMAALPFYPAPRFNCLDGPPDVGFNI